MEYKKSCLDMIRGVVMRKWIDVNDKLPKRKGFYFVYNPAMIWSIWDKPIAFYSAHLKKFLGSDIEVTHWYSKSLPNPPLVKKV